MKVILGKFAVSLVLGISFNINENCGRSYNGPIMFTLKITQIRHEQRVVSLMVSAKVEVEEVESLLLRG